MSENKVWNKQFLCSPLRFEDTYLQDVTKSYRSLRYVGETESLLLRVGQGLWESFRQGISIARFKCISFHNSVFSSCILVTQAWVQLRLCAQDLLRQTCVWGTSEDIWSSPSSPQPWWNSNALLFQPRTGIVWCERLTVKGPPLSPGEQSPGGMELSCSKALLAISCASGQQGSSRDYQPSWDPVCAGRRGSCCELLGVLACQGTKFCLSLCDLSVGACLAVRCWKMFHS